MRPEVVKELPYLLLKQYDKGQNAHAYQFVEDRTEQLHLQNIAHKEPYDDEDHDADEHIQRAALLHQAIDVVEQQGDKDDVDDVFYAKIKKHSRLSFRIGKASLWF